MKVIFIVILFLSLNSVAQIQKYETFCKKNNCFKYGWTTTSSSNSKFYSLDTNCKNLDCAKYGWFSVANDKSTYDVTCRLGGCFKDGWASTQKINRAIYYDDVFCKLSSCLNYGWNVRTGYDLMGGSVTCNYNDCSKYGGFSFWRGRPSRTTCYSNDCYKYGWTLFIY